MLTHLDVVDDCFAVGRRDGFFDGHDDVVVSARVKDGGTVGERDSDDGARDHRRREHGREFPHNFFFFCFTFVKVYTDRSRTRHDRPGRRTREKNKKKKIQNPPLPTVTTAGRCVIISIYQIRETKRGYDFPTNTVHTRRIQLFVE